MYTNVLKVGLKDERNWSIMGKIEIVLKCQLCRNPLSKPWIRWHCLQLCGAATDHVIKLKRSGQLIGQFGHVLNCFCMAAYTDFQYFSSKLRPLLMHMRIDAMKVAAAV